MKRVTIQAIRVEDSFASNERHNKIPGLCHTEKGDKCMQTGHGWFCTREEGHAGQHHAGIGRDALRGKCGGAWDWGDGK